MPLTVHGPAGAVDLVVPEDAQVMDVAREYAAHAGASAMPLLHDRRGRVLSPVAGLREAGVGAGHMLVATAGVHRGRESTRPAGLVRVSGDPGPLATLWTALAAAAAVLGGLAAAGSQGTTTGRLTCALLAAAALIGVLPVGRLVRVRVITAPVFAAAAAYAWFFEAQPDRLPGLLGLAALAAALVAAVARALSGAADEELKVWMYGGLAVFGVVALAAVVGASTPLVWSVLLIAAMLAARLAPSSVVDVPDDYLIDLERLAVSAWSARTRPAGRRGRLVVNERYVAQVAARGTRLLVATTVGVAVVAVVSAYRLVADTTLPLDRTGARILVLCAGAALLLAARTCRHPAARAWLRVGGLGVWASLLPVVAARASDDPTWVIVGAVLLAAIALVCAVAFGRGWRSAWWARRAEVAEGLAGAVALACLVVSTGAFRTIWEAVSLRN